MYISLSIHIYTYIHLSLSLGIYTYIESHGGRKEIGARGERQRVSLRAQKRRAAPQPSLCYTTLHYTIICYTIQYNTILYYTTLYYILYYTMLYYAILCYTSCGPQKGATRRHPMAGGLEIGAPSGSGLCARCLCASDHS